MAKGKKAETDEVNVEIDRRGADRRKQALPVAAERRSKVARRRQIDPTTCERDYTDDEIEFMHALDAYKRRSGRMFPTCSEILEVIRDMGYVRLHAAGAATFNPEAVASDAAESIEAPGELAS